MSRAMEIVSGMTANFIPTSLISEELAGVYGSTLLQELGELIKLYEAYDSGVEFTTEGSNGDYAPSQLRYKKGASLINKEARFLFAKHPDIKINVPYKTGNKTSREQAQNAMSVYQNLVDEVLDDNHFYSKLLKAAKDCFIGRRVAWFANFNEENGSISIDFIPSMEFIAEYREDKQDELQKIVTFYNLNDYTNREDQRIFKKKYWLENGRCYVSETVYNGSGEIVEALITNRATEFDFIPAGVIINDGLTGDVRGRSDMEDLSPYEEGFSKLANADIDSERKAMNDVTYTIDMNTDSTKNLSTAPGAFWDLQSDINMEGHTGTVGRLTSNIGYSGALDVTLNRITSMMYDAVDVPNVDLSTMASTITSGKALKAIYWPLIVKCDEKMLAWKPEIRRIVNTIILGSRLYPNSAAPYLQGEVLPEEDYTILVDNQYPLPEDEAEEKSMDLAQVSNKTMSIKSYMLKWTDKTADGVEEEILQIVKEQQMLQSAFMPMPTAGEPTGEV